MLLSLLAPVAFALTLDEALDRIFARQAQAQGEAQTDGGRS